MPVTNGQLLIDGVDSTILNRESYQRRIGYITQEPVIFTDTIFNNISFWAVPNAENIARFQWAIQQASINIFIEELPLKENTLLGNNGINLSGDRNSGYQLPESFIRR